MRLKKAGYIEGKKFVNQPSGEVIADALNAPEDEGEGILGSILKSLPSLGGD